MKSGLKKEFLYLSRTMRLFGVILTFVLVALFDPLMMKVTASLLEMVDSNPTLSEQVGGDDVTVNIGGASYENMTMDEMLGTLNDGANIAAIGANDIAGTAVLVILFIFMAPCGSEQKKRSVIIPRCAGLTGKLYAAPKFVLYPSLIFVCAFCGALLTAGFSLILFGGEIAIGNLLLAALSVALYDAFVIVLQLMIGICTGRPGIGVICTLLATSLVPTILQLLRVDRFNPFALPSAAVSVLAGEPEMLNIWVSIGVTVVLGAILYFTTLFALSATETDNSGGEPVL